MPHLIREQVSLAPYTTLGIGGTAEYFTEVTTLPLLKEVITWATNAALPITILGGGSNVLVNATGIRGLVIRIALRGITFHEEDDAFIVTAHAGESFDAFVEELVVRGIPGFENLSGIPGTVGATPIQNVGAYGVEIKDFLEYVEVYDVEHNAILKLKKSDCKLGYRDSIFKTQQGKKYVIVSVTFAFPKVGELKLSYKDLKEFFASSPRPTLMEIRNAIIHIRKGKFPDWTILGTAGSFFKNPRVTKERYEALLTEFPGLPAYAEPDGRFKIALGYVLDKILHLKGYRVGDVGLYEKQALVLVVYQKNISAGEVISFATHIAELVKEKIQIDIEWEVNELK